MPGTILVVDDIATNRTVLRAKLAARYYDVIEADCGEAAVELAQRNQPDLLLLDVLMPGIDGFEACRRLKANPTTMHIPIVMLTALDALEDRLNGLDAGADDFLTKPCEDMDLFTRVASLLRMKLMVDELRLRHETSRMLGLADAALTVAPFDYSDSSVLLASGNSAAAEPMVTGIRRRLGCAVEAANGERAARSLLASNQFDACVIGPELADGSPMALAAHLRGRPETRQTALMMVFPPARKDQAHLAMDMGVSDYLSDPPDFAELTARLKVQLRRKHYSDRLRSSVHESLVLAVTDPLTGLYNRRYANNHLEVLISRPPVTGYGLAAMILDLDNFKAVNDTHGHPAGDEVLREFASRLRENVRGVDLVGRIGGEEFLVVMPDILPEHACRVAERARAAVEQRYFVAAGGTLSLRVTVSIGLAFQRPAETGASLLGRADQALYASKTRGRNMVTLAAA